jgi:putative NADH-flavin reductase
VSGANRPVIEPLVRDYARTYPASMPVIVVGADTVIGTLVAEALAGRSAEVRAFVTDPSTAPSLRELGIKVAVGDVSDGSHIGGAAHGCFSAVLLTEAASDARERSFANGADEVLEAWHGAIAEAGITRAIWVGRTPPRDSAPESVVLDPAGRPAAEVVTEIVDLDDRPSL